MNVRLIVRRLHLLLGLTLGVVLSVVTLSGAAVAFRPELDRLHAAAPSQDAGTADRDAVAAMLMQRYGEVRIVTWYGPVAAGGVDEWWMRGTAPGGGSWKAFTDPSDGTWLGDTRSSVFSATLAWVARFHHDLHLGSNGGIVVGVCGFAMLAFIVSGLWLWLTGPLQQGIGFRRWTGTWRRWSLDLHVLAGVVGIPALLILAVTGTMFAFPWMKTAVHATLGGAAADAPPVRRPLAASPVRPATAKAAIGWTKAIAVASAVVPDGRPLQIPAPRSGNEQSWRVTMDYPGNPGPRSGVVVLIDGATWTVKEVRDPRTMTPGGWVVAQHWSLHLGTFGGLATRILWLVSGVLPTLLLVTGVALWWARHRSPMSRRDMP